MRIDGTSQDEKGKRMISLFAPGARIQNPEGANSSYRQGSSSDE
jgi:hypothetical protein